ncbi:MAG: tetratricopeptide repeat protein [Allomuricauda sp.]
MKLIHARFFLVFILVFTTNLFFGQTREIDSLQNLLKTAKDTTKVDVLRFLGQRLRSHDKEKAIEYLSQSVEKSREIGFIQGEILGLYSLGVTYGMTGGYAESQDYLNQCLALALKHNVHEEINSAYKSLGIVYKQIGDYSTSQSYYIKSLRLVDSLNLNVDNSNTYFNLGVLYDLMGQQDEAIESYQKALEVQKGPDRESLENSVLANLAVIDFNNGKYEAALEKILKKHAYLEKQGDNIALCSSYANIGSCYMYLEKWDLAQEYLEKSIQLAEQLSIKQEVVNSYNNLADLMLRQKRYKEAILYSTKNLEALNAMEGYEQKFKAHETAEKIYEATGQLPKAIYHLNQMMVYKDSLLNDTKVREIQNLQIQHDVYLKDKELKQNELRLALLNARIMLNYKRLTYLAIITILLMLSAGLLYFRFRSKKKSNAILSEKNEVISQQKEVIEAMNAQLEKRMLRAQMNPHFIFNSLSSIRHLVSSDDKESALTYLNKFSKLLRQVLETSINVNLVLHEEIELLKIYVELEALRFDNSFSYTFNIDENLDVYQHEVPMLLVQPYIENAILHGLLPKKGSKELSISFRDEKDHIVCIIEDNGVGFNPQADTKGSKKKSRGMSITEKRIEALGKFSNKELVKIENLNKNGKTGTRMTILIPKDQ